VRKYEPIESTVHLTLLKTIACIIVPFVKYGVCQRCHL